MNTKYLLIISLLLTMMLTNSCKEAESLGALIKVSTSPHSLTCDKRFDFEAKGGVKRMKISTQNTSTNWQITGMPEWLNVSKKSGNTDEEIELIASENFSVDEARIAILSMTSSDLLGTIDINVSQKAAVPYILVSESSISFLGAASSKILDITSNVTWNVLSSDTTWLKISKKSDSQLLVEVSENTSETRNATIYFMRENDKTALASITVLQAEAGVSCVDSELTFKMQGENKQVEFYSEASWSVATSDDSWISVSPNKGKNGECTIMISTTANQSYNKREGFVYIKIGDIRKKTINISQEGINIIPSIESLSFASNEESQTFNLSVNSDWEIVYSPEWLEITPNSGQHSDFDIVSINVKALDNPNTSQREGVIIIGLQNLIGNKEIKVVQEGKSFSDIIPQMDFDFPSSISTIEVKTNGEWTAYTSDTWISINPEKGVGDAIIEVTVDENTSNELRQGSIVVAVGDTKKEITVVQKSRYIELDYTDLIQNSRPCKIDVSVASNVDWTASSLNDWISVAPAFGTGDARIVVELSDNPHELFAYEDFFGMQVMTEGYREGKFIVSNSNMTEKVFSVRQRGRTLLADKSALEFYSANSSANIKLSTDGTFRIIPSDEWITVEETGDCGLLPWNVLIGTQIELGGIPASEYWSTLPVTFTVHIAKNEGETDRVGKITIELTDLADGEYKSVEIPITQKAKISNVEKSEWGEDEFWDF